MFFVIKFVRSGKFSNEEAKLVKQDWIKISVLIFLVGCFTILSNYGLVYKDHFDLQIGEHFLMVIGSFLFGAGIAAIITCFIIYYYRPDLNKKQRKCFRIALFVSIPVIIAGIWMFTDAFAPYLTYPLVNGISIPGGFTTPNNSGSGFSIKWYGIIIVCGAAVSYFVSDHYFYKKFEKHGILDTLLLVAFPAGIIGARLWYVTILEPGVNFWKFQEGGLAIQGGALMGIAVGVTFMLIFRKYVNIRWAMDIIVPTVLLAQAIGRWGNFFNHEVYGLETDIANWWFLPRIIVRNMYVTPSDLTKMYVPLFFVECCSNLAGYFIIRYGVGKGLKKVAGLGDQAMSYLIWYGLTRVILEPLRTGYVQGGHDGGFGYSQSYITAYIFIGLGIFGIAIFHIYDLLRTTYQEKPQYFIYKTFNKDKKDKELRKELKNNYLALVNNYDFKNKTNEEKKIIQAICLYNLLSRFGNDLRKEYMSDYFSNYYNIKQHFYDYRYAKLHKPANDIKSLLKIEGSKKEGDLVIVPNVYKTICQENNASELAPMFENALLEKYKVRNYLNLSFDENINFNFNKQ